MNQADEDSNQYKLYKAQHGCCTTFQNKLLQENYVNTLIGALRRQFYKEGVAEEFDSNLNLSDLTMLSWISKSGLFVKEGLKITLLRQLDLNFQVKQVLSWNFLSN